MSENFYSIEEHRHRFAAWAAGRASSVNGCRFSVEQAKQLIESAELHLLLFTPNSLPAPETIDSFHRQWRIKIIHHAKILGLSLTHGVAAKLINVYLKAGLVCGGFHQSVSVQALHPPIDSILLYELAKRNVGGFRNAWNDTRHIRWSKLDSQQYQTVIDSIRLAMPEQPLWEVERFWRGFQ